MVSDFKFIDELDINPLLISEKTGEGIAVDGRIKVRINEAKEALVVLADAAVHHAAAKCLKAFLVKVLDK